MWKAINKKLVASRETFTEIPKMPQAFTCSMVPQGQHFAYQHRERESIVKSRCCKTDWNALTCKCS